MSTFGSLGNERWDFVFFQVTFFTLWSWTFPLFVSLKRKKCMCDFIDFTPPPLFVSAVWLLGYAAFSSSSSLGMLSDALQLPRAIYIFGGTYQKSQL